MSEPKFTPGPWRIFKGNDNSKFNFIGIGEMTGDGITDAGFGVWRGGAEEAFANALLIAAAPDLYSSLLKLCAEVNGLLGICESDLRSIAGNTNINILDTRIAEARAALAKARGE